MCLCLTLCCAALLRCRRRARAQRRLARAAAEPSLFGPSAWSDDELEAQLFPVAFKAPMIS